MKTSLRRCIRSNLQRRCAFLIFDFFTGAGVILVSALLTTSLLSRFLGSGTAIREKLGWDYTHQSNNKPIPGPKSWCTPYNHSLDHWKIIYFIETSGERCLKVRQACSVESAARANPLLQVHVLMSSHPPPGVPEKDEGFGLRRDCQTHQILQQLPNVNIIYQDLSQFFKDTPLWRMYEDKIFEKSEYAYQHLSDAVRIALLYKHGGIYLDTDLIVLRPLHCLSDAVGFVDIGVLCIENDVLVFKKGHPFLWFLMQEMVTMYKPNERSSIGPLGITQKFKTFCDYQSDKVPTTQLHHCSNDSSMVLFGPEAFHPIGWAVRHRFFQPNFPKSELEMFRSSFSTHIYGSGHGEEAPETCLFSYLARNYCPSVYNYAMSRWNEF